MDTEVQSSHGSETSMQIEDMMKEFRAQFSPDQRRGSRRAEYHTNLREADDRTQRQQEPQAGPSASSQTNVPKCKEIIFMNNLFQIHWFFSRQSFCLMYSFFVLYILQLLFHFWLDLENPVVRQMSRVRRRTNSFWVCFKSGMNTGKHTSSVPTVIYCYWLYISLLFIN